jgi:hypothetical protein
VSDWKDRFESVADGVILAAHRLADTTPPVGLYAGRVPCGTHAPAPQPRGWNRDALPGEFVDIRGDVKQ